MLLNIWFAKFDIKDSINIKEINKKAEHNEKNTIKPEKSRYI